MKITRCANGHFFDEERYQNCPHCAFMQDDSKTVREEKEPVTIPLFLHGGTMKNEEDPPTMPLNWMKKSSQENMIDEDPVTMPLRKQSVQHKHLEDERMEKNVSEESQFSTSSLRDEINRARYDVHVENQDDERTIGFYHKKQKVSPVTGWLVCIEGPDYGMSYPLKAGKNYIGRGTEMDVVISGDKSVSRDKHAIILFEPKKTQFLAMPGESRELYYINDDVVLTIMPIKDRDIISLGDTKLLFVPLCGDSFHWEDYPEKKSGGV